MILQLIMGVGLLLAMVIVYLKDILKLKERLSNGSVRRSNLTANEQLYVNNFIDVKSLYLKQYGSLPWMYFVSYIDPAKVIDLIKQETYGKIESVYQRSYYNWQNERTEASKTVFCLAGKIIIEIAYDDAEIMYDVSSQKRATDLFNAITVLKAQPKEKEQEINIITLDRQGLDLKAININPVELDIAKFYNDDFVAVDSVIRSRLSKENDKGIILLHGIPGTGKTTYLRHLVASIDKKVLFVSPMVAANLMNPEFIDLLIDNPNSVLVIEDAENIIMDRKYSTNNSVSNLLNLSDGLMSDCLNVQIICTFNSPLTMVDSALLRKGRLIAKYEFGKLNVEKAQALSDHLQVNQLITKPSTLAEITNPGEAEHQKETVSTIGFRRHEVMAS